MSNPGSNAFPADAVRDDFIPKEDFLSQAFADREAEFLWPRTWQVACREEEIREIGDFVTYEIGHDSFIIMRTTSGEIRAFANVCPHRGRRLTEGCGHLQGIVCRFHGWSWDIDGNNTRVVDRDDWAGKLDDEKDLKLKTAQIDTWGGFVFLNMDPDAEPLEHFLAPMKALVERYEFEKLRFKWYRTVVLPVNWKLALELFNESYHVQQTHPQLLRYLQDDSVSGAYGRHGAFWNPPPEQGETRFRPSSRLDIAPDADRRKYVLAFHEEMHHELDAMTTPRTYEAVQRIMDELPEDATALEVLTKARALQKQAAIDDGAGWPDITPEYAMAARSDWHVFPNLVFLHQGTDGVLFYRARPHGTEPEKCIFDVWSLVRYAPGKEPPLEREFHEDWRARKWGRILTQDFHNIEALQQGMRARAFKGLRPSPVQEVSLSNFHRALRAFMQEGEDAAAAT
jgi:phenylpropionate dioxygenase-like ring-hydroxylating dioxygenase large terminal subunit